MEGTPEGAAAMSLDNDGHGCSTVFSVVFSRVGDRFIEALLVATFGSIKEPLK